MIRFSVIPSHISTAVFSTADVKFWHFAVATFLTLPKQIIIVYLGVLLVGGQDGSTVQDSLIAVGGVITIFSAVWIWFKLSKYKKVLLAEQAARKAERQGLNNVTTVDSSVSRLGLGVEPRPEWQENGGQQQQYQAYNGEGHVHPTGQQPYAAQPYDQPPYDSSPPTRQEHYYASSDTSDLGVVDPNRDHDYAAGGYGGQQGSLQAPGYGLRQMATSSSAVSSENAKPAHPQQWV